MRSRVGGGQVGAGGATGGGTTTPGVKWGNNSCDQVSFY